MRYSLQLKHITLTDLDHQLLNEKVDRLKKLVRPPYTIDIIISHDTHHSHGKVVVCRMNIEEGKRVFHAERTAASVQDALDEALEVAKQELHKDLQKRRDRERKTSRD